MVSADQSQLDYCLDTFEKISLFTQLSDVMEWLYIKFQNGTWSKISFTGIKFHPYHPGIQAQIDISKYVEGSTMKKISFSFKNSRDYSIEIKLDDDSWDTVRPLYKRRMRQKGTTIMLEKTEIDVIKAYFTTIRQIVHDEDDKKINCKNYPNEEFDSYEDCDMAFTRKTYQSLYHQKKCRKGKNISTENIVPIFATNNIDEATKIAHATADSDIKSGIFDLVLGTELSSCPRPCTTTFTDTMQTSIEPKVGSTNIHITFDNSIMVTKIKVDNFQMSESMNILGSELGLWPGLGIFQLIQWLYKNIPWGMLFEKCISRGHPQNVN